MRRLLVVFLMVVFQTINAAPAISGLEIPQSEIPLYASPTKRFNYFYNYEHILQSLRANGMSLEHRNFFEHILPHEELGFFGYHSSTQGFRIFQDIIRMVLEEKCGLEIKKDFHFLRVPGGSLHFRQSAKEFLRDYPVVNNNENDQQEQLLSINYTLFGNFNNFGSCSVYYFTSNSSATTVGFQAKLHTLFDLLDMPKNSIAQLFQIGHPLMASDNAILFQFFDFSHHNAFLQHYQLVDQMCYPSKALGIPLQNWNNHLSDLYLQNDPHPFTEQFRLVINNALILNPHSSLSIKRYERNDPSLVKEYEKNLREAIRNLSFDIDKAYHYRQLLLSLWGQDEF